MDIQGMRELIQLIKEAESIQDEGARKIIIARILDESTPEEGATHAVGGEMTKINGFTPRDLSNGSTGPAPRSVARGGRTKGSHNPNSRRNKVLNVVKELASHAKPVSAADLNGLVDGTAGGDIASDLSRLYIEGQLKRVKAFDQDAGGTSRSLYKYYCKEDG